MKNLPQYIVFLLIVLIGCVNDNAIMTDVYVFIDITEKSRQEEIYLGDIPEILEKMNIDIAKGGYSGGEVRYFLINDVSESKSEKIVLNRGHSGLMGQNPLDRVDEIKKFKTELKTKLVDLLKKAEWDREKSEIYQNVCRGLNKLTQSASQQKVAIIYSDMLENSNLFTFYGKDQSKITTTINQIERIYNERFSKNCNLPDLSNVEIHVVAIRTKKNDTLINLSEKFWEKLFEYKHAKNVSFGAALDL